MGWDLAGIDETPWGLRRSGGAPTAFRSDDPPARDQPDDHDDDRDDEQDVDEPARDVEDDEAEEPENEQDDGDGPEHGKSSVENETGLRSCGFMGNCRAGR